MRNLKLTVKWRSDNYCGKNFSYVTDKLVLIVIICYYSLVGLLTRGLIRVILLNVNRNTDITHIIPSTWWIEAMQSFYWSFTSLDHFWPHPIFNPGYAYSVSRIRGAFW